MGRSTSLPCGALIFFIGLVFYALGYFALPQTYEFFVSHSTLQLKMKILGDGRGYSLREFCTETDGFVEVAET